MKKVLAVLFALFILAGCSSTAPAATDQGLSPLHVYEGQLCDKDNNPVQLKGVSTHSLPRSERRINPDLFRQIHEEWGVQVVRLAMYTEANDSYNKTDYFKEKNLELIDNGISYATDNDMYAIIDWHILSDGNPKKYQDKAVEFFDNMSQKYADYTNVIYEICNEPNNCGWQDVKEYAQAVIPVIRANAPDAVIIVGTTNWSQDVDIAMADPLDFDNIMYTLHFYAASHKEELQSRLIEVAENKFPVFVTEYGICANTGSFPRDTESADKWMEILDEYNISSCIWSFSSASEAASIFDWNSLNNTNVTAADLSDTGRWFIDMLKK